MLATILTLLTLLFTEIALSLDNLSLLVIMVKDLPTKDASKALRWGIWGAYLMRGILLLCIGVMVRMWPLKLIAGVYLLYLTYGFFTKEDDTLQEDVQLGTQGSKVYKWVLQKTKLSQLWATILLIEFIDLSLSVDNLFAAVAISSIKWLVCIGVFMGIAVMRLLVGYFVVLMKKYPSLERSAFIVIGLLGIKLVIYGIAQPMGIIFPQNTDIWFSICLLFIFIIPIIYGRKVKIS